MTENHEPLRHFRSEVPPPSNEAWAAVRGEVAREISAELERPDGSWRMRRGWSPRLLAAGLATLVLSGAVAYGATTLIGVGSPAPNPPAPLTPSNIKLLGLRVADPGGGPPWGIRLALSRPLRTSTPDVAIQIGRVDGGKLGFVGQDNAFHDDHLFHAAGPNSALITPANYSVKGTPQKPDLQSVYHFALTLPAVPSAVQGCSTIKVPLKSSFRESKRAYESDERFLEERLAELRSGDAAARRYARASGISIAALRLMISETLKREREHASGFVSERTFATCPHNDLRTIVFGFSGPSSTSVTISGLGVHESESLASDDDGFYLFVLSSRWSYASKFHTSVTCAGGRTATGMAAPGTPDPARCPTA
jgi:hypothetical protein